MPNPGKNPANAGPDANHAGNFNQAIRELLRDWPDNKDGDFRLEFAVTINPGTIREYRVTAVKE